MKYCRPSSPTSTPSGSLGRLRDAGLRCLETSHPEHDDAQREHYASLAASLSLVPTAGSDFHGSSSRGGTAVLGSVTAPDEVVARLAELASSQA